MARGMHKPEKNPQKRIELWEATRSSSKTELRKPGSQKK